MHTYDLPFKGGMAMEGPIAYLMFVSYLAPEFLRWLMWQYHSWTWLSHHFHIIVTWTDNHMVLACPVAAAAPLDQPDLSRIPTEDSSRHHCRSVPHTSVVCLVGSGPPHRGKHNSPPRCTHCHLHSHTYNFTAPKRPTGWNSDDAQMMLKWCSNDARCIGICWNVIRI